MQSRGIKYHEQFNAMYNEAMNKAIKDVSNKIYNLLMQHINTDTYGVSKGTRSHRKINDYYLNGTGIPSYEFKYLAWQDVLKDNIYTIVYNGLLMSPPSADFPYLHGNYKEGIDRRERLAELLNVSGVASEEDMESRKIREPFWDNFLEDLSKNLGHWLYMSFKKQGLNIPELENITL